MCVNVLPNSTADISDLSQDGRLRVGDQLVAINKESMVGITDEEARRILTRSRFRQDSCTDVSFVPSGGRIPGVSGSSSSPSSQHKFLGNGLDSCRLKVHVRSPECRHENHVPFSSPDICPPELTVSAPVSPPYHGAPTGNKHKVSLDPHVRLKEDKVELILQFLGLDIPDEKKRELHQGLITDCQGTIAYGDFLQVLRGCLQDELELAGLDYSSLLFTHYEVANLLDTSAFHCPVTKETDVTSCSDSLELEQLQEEVSDLRKEVRRLEVLLRETENSKRATEDELHRLNQKVLGVLSQNRCLQNKLQGAELAQCQAHSAEHDYEEVIHLLEAEITELKSQMPGKKKQMASAIHEGLDPNRRLSLSDCQLRKSELTRKHLEISNKRLLSFVQVKKCTQASLCCECIRNAFLVSTIGTPSFQIILLQNHLYGLCYPGNTILVKGKIQKVLTTSLQLTDEMRVSNLENRENKSTLNVPLPSAELLVTEVSDILESCNYLPTRR
ncbi:hypothetical protein FKM82_002788 [Ascaphus truei]